jgi:hypothetical protein
MQENIEDDMLSRAYSYDALGSFVAMPLGQLLYGPLGEAFGARDVDDFVRKAHAFVGDPPKGTLCLSRANGDVLLYDPKANVFAVATKAGAPRTMFKPTEGMAYWDEQKAREAKRQASSRERRVRDRDDEA